MVLGLVVEPLKTVEDYHERLHRGKLRASNLLNVPDALLDAERVASRVVGTLAILAGTVLGVRRGESDLTWLLFEKTFREEDSSPGALQIKSKMSPGAFFQFRPL